MGFEVKKSSFSGKSVLIFYLKAQTSVITIGDRKKFILRVNDEAEYPHFVFAHEYVHAVMDAGTYSTKRLNPVYMALKLTDTYINNLDRGRQKYGERYQEEMLVRAMTWFYMVNSTIPQVSQEAFDYFRKNTKVMNNGMTMWTGFTDTNKADHDLSEEIMKLQKESWLKKFVKKLGFDDKKKQEPTLGQRAAASLGMPYEEFMEKLKEAQKNSDMAIL